jgi:hypothetical protein
VSPQGEVKSILDQSGLKNTVQTPDAPFTHLEVFTGMEGIMRNMSEDEPRLIRNAEDERSSKKRKHHVNQTDNDDNKNYNKNKSNNKRNCTDLGEDPSNMDEAGESDGAAAAALDMLAMELQRLNPLERVKPSGIDRQKHSKIFELCAAYKFRLLLWERLPDIPPIPSGMTH